MLPSFHTLDIECEGSIEASESIARNLRLKPILEPGMHPKLSRRSVVATNHIDIDFGLIDPAAFPVLVGRR